MSLQLLTNDTWYYQSTLIEIKQQLDNPKYLIDIQEIIQLPTQKQIKDYLTDKTIAFLAPQPIEDNNLIIKKMLPNTQDDGTRTLQQKLYNENINTELYNKYGMSVSEPKANFDSLKGFQSAKDEMLKAQRYVEKGYIQKNLSLFLGVSRSGKSYFAECLAGELHYKLILLDLGIILASKNPPKLLDNFLNYLQNIDNYVLLIDEIEKVVDPNSSDSMSKVMIGKLLTVFNDFNTEKGFNIKNNFVIATANNITTLLEKNPEFINRFSLKYFIGYPVKETFIDIANYYLKTFKINGINGENIYNLSSTIYAKNEIPKMNLTNKQLFGKYAAGEIKELMTNLLLSCKEIDSKLYCNPPLLREILKIYPPQIEFANKGVIKTISAAKKANFKEIN